MFAELSSMARNLHSKPKDRDSKLIGLTLLGSVITLGQFEEEREQEAVFEYQVSIEDMSVEDNLLLFSCELSIVKRYGEQDGAEIARFEASYFCGVSRASKSIAENEALAGLYAETAAWHAFSALAAVVTSQMRVSFPALPPTPTLIRFKKPDIEHSAASGT